MITVETKFNEKILQVELLLKAGKILQAELLLHPMLSDHPLDFRVNFYLALIAMEAGMLVIAENFLRIVLKTGHKLPSVYFFLGLCLGRQNRFKQAIKAFEFVLMLNPGYENAQTQIKYHNNLSLRFKKRYSRQPIKIALLTTVWKRAGVTKFVLNHYNNLRTILDIELIKLAVGSEGKDSRELCESSGWDYLEYENRPLSKKWQAGLYALRTTKPDFVITVGSDDLLSTDYFRKIIDRCPIDGCTGIYDFWFLDLKRKQMGYWSEMNRSTPFGGGYIRTLGAGRCYSKRILDNLNWELWPNDQDSGLDGLAEKKMLKKLSRKPTCYSLNNLGSFALDIKSEKNLWHFNDYRYEKILDQKNTASSLKELELSPILDIES